MGRIHVKVDLEYEMPKLPVEYPPALHERLVAGIVSGIINRALRGKQDLEGIGYVKVTGAHDFMNVWGGFPLNKIVGEDL
jgi:hypothetical protein